MVPALLLLCLTIDENLPCWGWKMNPEYSGCRLRFPRHHSVLVWWDHLYYSAVSVKNQTLKSHHLFYQEPEARARSKVMQETSHSYLVQPPLHRKYQATYSAPASDHQVKSTSLSRCPLVRVTAYHTSQGWVVSPTIPLGGHCSQRRLLISTMPPAISLFNGQASTVPRNFRLRTLWRSSIIWGLLAIISSNACWLNACSCLFWLLLS